VRLPPAPMARDPARGPEARMLRARACRRAGSAAGIREETLMNTRLLIVLVASRLAMMCCACGGTGDELAGSGALRVKAAGTTVGEDGDTAGSSLTCPSPSTCFQLATGGANITHVFVAV